MKKINAPTLRQAWETFCSAQRKAAHIRKKVFCLLNAVENERHQGGLCWGQLSKQIAISERRSAALSSQGANMTLTAHRLRAERNLYYLQRKEHACDADRLNAQAEQMANEQLRITAVAEMEWYRVVEKRKGNIDLSWEGNNRCRLSTGKVFQYHGG